MKTKISEDIIHIVILDIRRLYTQIHDEMWTSKAEYEQIKQVYADNISYKIVEL